MEIQYYIYTFLSNHGFRKFADKIILRSQTRSSEKKMHLPLGQDSSLHVWIPWQTARVGCREVQQNLWLHIPGTRKAKKKVEWISRFGETKNVFFFHGFFHHDLEASNERNRCFVKWMLAAHICRVTTLVSLSAAFQRLPFRKRKKHRKNQGGMWSLRWKLLTSV